MTSASARAFWIVAPGRGEIRDEPVPAPGPDDVVVRAELSAISRGTESIVFQGRVPASEHQRMRAPFQTGDFPAPVKYGYASVGRVEHGPRELVDRRVFVLYPHQTRYVVPAIAVHVLPDDVPSRRAVLAANLETAVNGLWDAHPRLGDRIVVIGAGTVGCLVAWLASGTRGTSVELVDVNPDRQSVAAALGVRFATPSTVTPDADLVIHASGSASGLELACAIANVEATIVEMSWYGDQVVPLRLGEHFHVRRLSLKSSQVGTITPAQRPRWDSGRRMRLVMALLADPVLDALVTEESDFDELPSIMPRVATMPGASVCHRIRYSRSFEEG